MNERDLKSIRDYLDDRIEPKDLDRLNQLLENNADARAEFRAIATLEEGLRDFSIASEFSFLNREEHAPEQSRSSWFRTYAVGIAALFLLFIGVAFTLLQMSNREEEWGDAIAKIEFLSDDVKFDPDHQLPDTEGEFLSKGWIQLERGRARILFRSGATVEAVGPAALGIDSPMRAYLDFGKVSAYAPESARDFVIATESMEVVDLGTRFEVEVDQQTQESNVSVIEGLVDLHLGSRGTERTIRPLEAGFAARVDASGKIVEITDGSVPPLKVKAAAPRILAHWALDGTLDDSSGNQLDGVMSTGTQPAFVSGVSRQALAFTQNGSVDLSEHLSTLGQMESFTFASWVRDPGEPLAVLFSVSGDSELHRVQLYLARRFVRFGWQDGLHFDSISGQVDDWKSGQWYHVAVSVEGGIARIYRDGKLIAFGSDGSRIGTSVSTLSLVQNASHAYLGRLEDGRQGDEVGPQWFRGVLDDIQIYSGALNQKAVQFICEHPGEQWTAEKTSQ